MSKTQFFQSRGTGYYPDPSPLEGGFEDRHGKPLCTLEDYLDGSTSYVSVAMDRPAFPYGTVLLIPEISAHYQRYIVFRVVDTGDAFVGKGTSRIDICTRDERHSLSDVINRPLTLIWLPELNKTM